MSKEEQFDFYWKEIFTGLAYNPIEFNAYRFDQSMSLPGKVNKLYDLFKVLATNNQEVMDYLKEFVETFDEKLYETIEDVLNVWVESGKFDDIIASIIDSNDIIIEFNKKLEVLLAKSQLERDEFFNGIKDIIETLDPSGVLLAEIVNARIKADGETFPKLGERLNTMDTDIDELLEFKDTSKGIPSLKYKTVSSTVTPTQPQNGLTDDTINHLLYQGASSVLCIMVGITSASDPTPTMLSNSTVEDNIKRARAKNLPITMLKPHLGVNYSDGFNRGSYEPSNYKTFFANWKVVLMNYAQMCTAYNIPFLCLGCEQAKTTVNTYAPYWKDIAETIKTSYPNLLLTYSANGTEWLNDNQTDYMQYLDYIGVNIYQTYSMSLYTENKYDMEEMKKTLYSNMVSREASNPPIIDKPIYRLAELNRIYEKPIFVTEVGTMAYNDSLAKSVSSLYQDPLQTKYYDCQALVMEAFYNEVCKLSFVEGVSWWHTAEPFKYFKDDATTSAEAMLTKLYKEVL